MFSYKFVKTNVVSAVHWVT